WPHLAVVEVRVRLEPDRRVADLELRLRLVPADRLAVLAFGPVGGHAVVGARDEAGDGLRDELVDALAHRAIVRRHLRQALPQHLEALGALLLRAHAGRGLALAGRRRDRGAFGLAEDLVVIARLVLALGGRLGWHGLILLVVRGG